MTIGSFFDNLWNKIGAWVRPMVLLFSCLILANGAVVSILISQLIDLTALLVLLKGQSEAYLKTKELLLPDWKS